MPPVDEPRVGEEDAADDDYEAPDEDEDSSEEDLDDEGDSTFIEPSRR